MAELKRQITPRQLLIITFGSTIGSGWLFAPYYTAKYAGSYAPLTWAIGALAMGLIMLCFIELSVLDPKPGSMTRFSRRTHGPLVGNIYGLFLWFGMLSLPPIETSAILQYAANAWPSLGAHSKTGFALSYAGLGAAVVILFLMVLVNIMAMKWFAKVSNLLVVIKVLIPISLVGVLLICAFHWKNFTVSSLPDSEIIVDVMKALSLGGVIFAYTGFSNALQLAGEVENPTRAIPFALLGTCVLTSLLYIALQISYIGAFPPEQLSHGWQPVVLAAEKGPFLVLLEMLKLSWFLPLMVIASCLSPFVAGLISLSGSSRTLFALSEDGVLPKCLTTLDGKGTPKRAILVSFAIGLMLLFPLPGWNKLVALLVSMIAFVYSIGPISMGTLRLTNKELARPFRVKGAHLVALLALLAANRIIFWCGADTVYLISLLAFVFYGWGMIFKTEKKDRALEFQSSWWVLFYALSLSIIAYFGDFGGEDLLTLKQQASIISLLSLVVYLLALYCGMNRFKSSTKGRSTKL